MTKFFLMIVDDDKDDRFFFRNAVKEIDPSYECLEAQDGLEALEKLRKADTLPHFIFLDLNMPIMNGKECLMELKKDEKLKNIPVIIYSTSNYKEDIDSTRELGAVYYLTKLFDVTKLPDELIKAMETAGEYVGHER